MATKLYPTDQTDHQWKGIEQRLPAPATRGRKRQLDMRHVLNAILYVVVGGIPWRMLPKEYPKWKSVYHCFRLWRNTGLGKRIHDTLRARCGHDCARR